MKRRKLIPVLIVGLLVIAFGAHFALRGKPAVPGAVPTVKIATMSESALKEWIGQRYGSDSANMKQVGLMDRVGQVILTRSEAKDSRHTFHFHLTTEQNAIDMIATSSGDIYVTTALMNRLRTEGELAAVLSSGVAHIMNSDEMQISGTSQPTYTMQQELAADARAVKIMSAAGYDPDALTHMLGELSNAYYAHADVPFFTTHPNAEGRIDRINAAIKALYPNGVPAIMSK